MAEYGDLFLRYFSPDYRQFAATGFNGFNGIQRYSTVFDDGTRRYSTVFNGIQRYSTVFDDGIQRYSTVFEVIGTIY